jgi:hypothetical protein
MSSHKPAPSSAHQLRIRSDVSSGATRAENSTSPATRAHHPRWNEEHRAVERRTPSAGEGEGASFRGCGAGEAWGPRYSAPSPWRRRSAYSGERNAPRRRFRWTANSRHLEARSVLARKFRPAAPQLRGAAQNSATMTSHASPCSKCALGGAEELRNHRARAEAWQRSLRSPMASSSRA